MDTPAVYQIRIQALLDDRWSSWFDGMAMSCESSSDGLPVTTLTGSVADQSALHGVLAKIRDLGLTLISVERVHIGSQEAKQ